MLYKTVTKSQGIAKALAVERIFNDKLLFTIADNILFQELVISLNKEQIKELKDVLDKFLEEKNERN